MSTDQARPLRADAARNRARLLDAAEEVFTARGTGVRTEEVAKAAGVGVGTLFRHFPTKEALLQAVLVRRMERLGQEAERLRGELGPGEAFLAFFALVVDASPSKNEFADALAAAGVDVREATQEAGKVVLQAVAELLADAQRAGRVRPDLGVPEVTALMVGASRALEHLDPQDGPARRRAVEVVLAGLGAG
ncbi:TetR/AcrR family transcriptional regulator [Streptomyces tateyamensis]|uniref:TetR/AcrR family transcriptional regulator n=1 Tax=Streptomyces tateyamensis TaxID=565073 RepID=UPI0015E8C034|nr:TetR/AcrR family transcriptional regulator [Streptomyces tateyamensis]